MKLIVQPDDGIAPIVTGIKQAKKTIDVLIFRLDRVEIAHALEQAVARGVHVRALTAHQNRGGTKSLRKLEMHLLEGGVTVSRTADDLVRYHGKMMIIDGRVLHVYGYNFTSLDIEADFERQPYTPGNDRFVVSPENARERLSAFIKGARKQLLIYDPKVSDDAMLKVICGRMEAGVDVRVIGKVASKSGIRSEKYPGKRLHIRAIIRDGSRAFLGSQSLRRLELEKRREVGIIITDERVVLGMRKVFEDDWAQTDSGKKDAKKAEKAEKKEEKALAAAS
jgi:cardiolipin synthase